MCLTADCVISKKLRLNTCTFLCILFLHPSTRVEWPDAIATDRWTHSAAQVEATTALPSHRRSYLTGSCPHEYSLPSGSCPLLSLRVSVYDNELPQANENHTDTTQLHWHSYSERENKKIILSPIQLRCVAPGVVFFILIYCCFGISCLEYLL